MASLDALVRGGQRSCRGDDARQNRRGAANILQSDLRYAVEHGLPLLQPERLKDENFR